MMNKHEEKNLTIPTNLEPWINDEHIGKEEIWHSNKVTNPKP
jgi:hypothetical protein